MAATGVTSRHSRRGFLRATLGTVGASVLTASIASCSSIPLIGSKKKMQIWADATFAPPSDDYQTKEIQKWAKDKGVEISITRSPGGDNQKKLQASIEAKKLPNIAQVDTGRFTQFYPANIFVEVSDLFKEFAQQWNGFYKPAETIVTVNGKQWALPYSIDTSLILSRLDFLKKAGIQTLPKTWDELFSQAKQAQRPPDYYGTGFQLNKAGTDSENTFSMMMYGFGASLVKEDSQTLNIDTPEMEAFLEYVIKTRQLGTYNPGVEGWDNNSNNTALQDGKSVFIHNPASPLVWARQNKPELLPLIGVSATPAGPKGQFNSAYLRDGFAILKSADDSQIQLSRDLMRHLYSKDVYSQWMTLAFPAPAVKGLENLEIWKNPQRGPFLDAAKTGVLNGYPGRPTPAYGALGNQVPVLGMVIRVLVDKWTPKQAIQELVKVATPIYAKYYK